MRITKTPMIRAAQSHLIYNQEIVLNIDDPHLAAVTNNDTWKTDYYPVSALCEGILKWRVDGQLLQKALGFMTPDDREFLLTGITPALWDKLLPPSPFSQVDGDDVPF